MKKVIGSVVAALALAVTSATAPDAPASAVDDDRPTRYYYDDAQDETAITDTLEGDLDGLLLVGQSHLLPATGNAAAQRPTLVSARDALAVLVPTGGTAYRSVTVTARDGDTTLGTLTMDEGVPQTPYAGEDEAPDLELAAVGWSARLPAEWIRPGLSLELRADGATGTSDVEVGPRTEGFLQNLNVGMFTDPSPREATLSDPTNVARYHQTSMFSELTVGSYAPIRLDRVVLPDGTDYTAPSPNNGTIHAGDLREWSKNVLAWGVNDANYGVQSDAAAFGTRLYQQTAATRVRGAYANGVVAQGLSGGDGVLTLLQTSGNELSHEYGHDLGLGHHEGTEDDYVHDHDSGWLWDATNGTLHPNVFRGRVAADSWDKDGAHRLLDTYTYRTDAMAGGVPLDGVGYTHYTDYSAWKVQQRLNRWPVHEETSPSGYARWDEDAQDYVDVPADDTYRKAAEPGVEVRTIIGQYDPEGELPGIVYPALRGSWGNVYEPLAPTGDQCALTATFADGSTWEMGLEGARGRADRMNRFQFNVPAQRSVTAVSVDCAGTSVLDSEVDQPEVAAPAPAVTVGGSTGYAQAYGASSAVRTAALGETLPDARAGLPVGEADTYVTHYVRTGGSVVSSTATRPEGRWWAGPGTDTIVVRATGDDGEPAEITLRASNLRDGGSTAYPLNGGYGKANASHLRVEYRPEDNPDLAPGSYDVDLTVQRHGWHTDRSYAPVRITDTITVAPQDVPTLPIGAESEDLRPSYGQFGDIIYVVPLTDGMVTESDTLGRGRWYGGTGDSHVTAIARRPDGTEAELALRVNRNLTLPANAGRATGTRSTVSVSFHGDDNPGLTPGRYQVEVPVTVWSWHQNRAVGYLRFSSEIEVSPGEVGFHEVRLGVTQDDRRQDVPEENRDTFVSHSVPVGGQVVSSTATAEKGAWYPPAGHDTVVVRTETSRGAPAEITLRVSNVLGGVGYPVNGGFPEGVPSHLRVEFVPEDNPGLMPDSYDLQFRVRRYAWHAGRELDPVYVADTLTVTPQDVGALTLGEQSQDFSKRYTTTDVMYVVPVAEGYVTASDALGRGRWYSGRGHSTVTAVAVSTADRTDRARVRLRVTRNGDLPADSGRGRGSRSTVTVSYDPADNPDLDLTGDYRVQVPVTVWSWHQNEPLEQLLVDGVISF